jgi:hypothetical protein
MEIFHVAAQHFAANGIVYSSAGKRDFGTGIGFGLGQPVPIFFIVLPRLSSGSRTILSSRHIGFRNQTER